MNRQLLDLYSDYLIASFSYTTATGLSNALNGLVSHDQVTRFLSTTDYNSKTLWQLVKPVVRQIESPEGVLIFDDTIEPKPYTDESEFITYHFDHTTGKSIKGINMLSCLYHNQGMNIPVGFEPITKPLWITDKKTGKLKRKSEQTKNELFRDMLSVCTYHNQIQYTFVLADVWYGATENMEHIKCKLHKEFIMPIKANRLIAFSLKEKLKGQWQQVSTTNLEAGTPYEIYVKGLAFPVQLVKQVFTNEDGSQGILYLVCSDLAAATTQIIDIYQKRWNIEPQYKSLKSNLGLGKSPTQTTRTQVNHIFSTLYAYFKLEQLKLKTGLNHFALKTKLYLKALQGSMSELQSVKERYCLR
jgi:SRSO17 transposase